MAGDKRVQFGGEVQAEEGTAAAGPTVTTASNTEIPPSAARRQTLARTLGTRGPFCGIKNLGATCYMNSLLQSLFATPELREHILTWNFDLKQRHAQNIAFQLQLLFYQMTHPRRSYVDAKALVDSFGMGSGAYHQQHDVQELNRKLLDVVQNFIDRHGSAPQVLRSLYEGQFRDYKRCMTCKYETSSYSTFQDISVVIDGIPSLQGAIAAFTNPDFIDGVTCDNCAAPREVAKGLTYDKIPRVFTIQLLRMQYNNETGRRDKVHQDVKLPLTLDMTHYDAEGIFELHSVIAHRGTAYHGHYYTYSRVNKDTTFDAGSAKPFVATPADVGGRWVKFDDDTVTYAEPSEIEEYIDPAAWKERATARDAAEHTARSAPAVDIPQETVVNAPSSDNDEDAVANLFIDDSQPRAKPLKTVSGHSYYAVYRRVDLPWPSEAVDQLPPNVPAYVSESVSESDKTFEKDTAELRELERIVPVGLVWQGVKRWIDARSETTISELNQLALHHFRNDEAPKFARLRSYSSSFGVLGATHDGSATLADLGFDSATLKSYPVFGLEITDDTNVGCLWAGQRITEWDIKLNLHQYNAEDDTFVDLNPTKAEWRPEFTFHADATISDVYSAAARRIGAVHPASLYLSIVRKGGAEPVDVSVETGLPNDIATTRWRDLAGTADTDRVLVEPREGMPQEAPADVSIVKPWLLSRAAIFTERKHQAVVTAKYFGTQGPVVIEASDDSNSTEKEPTPAVEPQREVVLKVDERKSLTELKVILCKAFDVPFTEVQLLVDGARREPSTLTGTIRGASYATKKLAVAIVAGAPLAPDETYIEIFQATGDYNKPVSFICKQLIRIGKTTKSALLESLVNRVEFTSAGLPNDASRIRMRLMPSQRTSSLGVPMLKDIVTENATSHHIDELRVVLQPLERPDVTMTKSTLILNLHHWNSVSPNAAAALGPRVELVTAKDAPATELVNKIAELLQLPESAPTNTDESESLPPYEFAKCRAFQLTDHATVAKLPWGLIDVTSAADLAKHLGGFPLRLEQEDIVLFRKPTDPWPTGVVQQFGEVIGGKTVVSKKRGKGAAVAGTGKKSGGDKARRDEPGIHLHTVWEMPEEEVVNTETVASDAKTNVDSAPSAPTHSGRGVPVDFLASCAYSKDQHASLEETCNVCFGEFEDGEVVCILHCYHVFHQDCLAPWTSEHGTCPKCLVYVLQ